MKTWEHIYKDNSERLLGVCRRYVASDDIAEDIMHDAFETAIKKIDSYSGKGSLNGWLYQITVNTALQYLRKNKSTINKTDDVLDFHAKTNEEESLTFSSKQTVYQAEFDVSDLIESIDELPEHHRTVFNLYVLEKYSHQEISKELGISVNTSKSHLNRARKKLQKLLVEKAKNKEKKNIKKYIFLFFPFLFSIDRLYAQKLKNYKLTPVSNTSFNFSKLEINHTQSLWNRSSIFIASSSIVLVGGIIVFFILKNQKSDAVYTPVKTNKVLDTGKNIDLQKAYSDIDSLLLQAEKQEESLNTENYVEQHKSKKKDTTKERIKNIPSVTKKPPVKVKVPVVVHKQIVIKDTINENK